MSTKILNLTPAEHKATVIRRVQRVADEMEDIAQTLNDGRSNCTECGLTKYDNLHEHLMVRALRSAASKMRKMLNHRMKPGEGEGE